MKHCFIIVDIECSVMMMLGLAGDLQSMVLCVCLFDVLLLAAYYDKGYFDELCLRQSIKVGNYCSLNKIVTISYLNL